MRSIGIYLFVVLFCILTIKQSVAQTAAIPPPNPKSIIALHESLIRRTALLNDKIHALKAASNQGSGLRLAVCTKLKLQPTDCDAVLDWSSQASAKLTALDQQAKAIIDAVRAAHPHRPKGTGGALLPPPPPELARLQAQREALIESETAQMLTTLTPNGAGMLQVTAFTAKQ
ncbi:MAG TPA: hypothetical protein VG297_17845 [Bryobacteraceae bacterium]|jgi:hypothetical protein|nr:hypothetical protein [Bryobacteraceae bacterium]